MQKSLASILVGGVLTAAAIGPGFAADMVLKAAPRPFVAADSWTGFYVGGNVGYGWSASDATATFAANPPPPGGGHVDLAGAGAPVSFNMSGAVGGFQLGYNWQLNQQWVVGLEADFDLSGIKGQRLLEQHLTGRHSLHLDGRPAARLVRHDQGALGLLGDA